MEYPHTAVSPGWRREFDSLPRRAQILRMRRLAEAALAAYDLPPNRLTLIAHFFNTTFRVDTATAGRYLLRIHQAGRPTVETVGSGMAWLDALRRDTGLEVPTPVLTREGALLTVAWTQGIPQPHICTLFRWMPGRRMRHRLAPRQMEMLGRLMAQLENHAAVWERPAGFVRPRVDWPVERARWASDPFGPETIGYVRQLVSETLSPEEAERVVVALGQVRAVENRLAAEPGTFGLIHADLHHHNLLFDGHTIRAIDFDDCGFGPLLYDPAVMLSQALNWEEYPELRAALLRGYRSARSLSSEHEALIDTFIALRQMQDGFWVLEQRQRFDRGPDWAAQARQLLAPVPALVAGRHGRG